MTLLTTRVLILPYNASDSVIGENQSLEKPKIPNLKHQSKRNKEQVQVEFSLQIS